MATRETLVKDPALLSTRRKWWAVEEWLKSIWEWILHEPSMRLIIQLGLLVLVLACVTFFIERRAAALGDGTSINSLGKALYWMFITGTTTGYGDITPKTPLGRFLTVLIIFFTLVLTSVFTATIASLFVEKRIMEGRGMEKINFKNHIVICGWNNNASKVLEYVFRDSTERIEVILVNNLPEQEINEILYTYRRKELKFVRGDFGHESVLNRANVPNARMVMILADGSVKDGYSRADERTILTALAVKSLNSQVKVCAEVVDQENAQHLRRANVDIIVVLGEYNDFLLSNSVVAPGVTMAAKELLNPELGSLIQQVSIPSSLVDKDFRDLSRYFREKKGAIVIGVVSEEQKGMTLDDVLSEDMTAVDLFIKKQFEGIEADYFFKGAKLRVRINPEDDYKVQKGDHALLIAEPARFSA